MEDQTIVLAAPRTGKSGWLADRIIDHPGAVVTSTARTDLFENTAMLRGQHGTVHVFNPEGIGGVLSTFRWNPLQDCEQPAVALKRAASFTAAGPAVEEATSPGPGEGFDVAEFVSGRNTLYMIGTGREEAPIGPLFRAFAEYVHDGAAFVGSLQPHGRLDPPLLMALDEVTQCSRVCALRNRSSAQPAATHQGAAIPARRCATSPGVQHDDHLAISPGDSSMPPGHMLQAAPDADYGVHAQAKSDHRGARRFSSTE
jgi:type IV secretory pathway TraG/TraD family ATPase VirD4